MTRVRQTSCPARLWIWGLRFFQSNDHSSLHGTHTHTHATLFNSTTTTGLEHSAQKQNLPFQHVSSAAASQSGSLSPALLHPKNGIVVVGVVTISLAPSCDRRWQRQQQKRQRRRWYIYIYIPRHGLLFWLLATWIGYFGKFTGFRFWIMEEWILMIKRILREYIFVRISSWYCIEICTKS